MRTADKQFRDAQALYKQHFKALLCKTTEKVPPRDSVYVGKKLADQAHTLTSVANGLFPVAAFDLHTVTIQRSGSSIKKIFSSRLAKPTDPISKPLWEPPLAIDNQWRNLNLRARRHLCTFASHGSTLEERGTGGTSIKFGDSFTPLQGVKYYRALDTANVLKRRKYVIFRTVDGPKPTSVGRVAYIVYVGMEINQTLTRGDPSIKFYTTVFWLTASTRI